MNMTEITAVGYRGKYGVKVGCIILKYPYLCYCKVERGMEGCVWYRLPFPFWQFRV